MAEITSPTPLYHRIYNVLRERVVNGYYPAEIAMPSEAELADSFAASRITIRKAMQMLTSDGLVTRTRGRGTFVTAKAQRSSFNRSVVSDVQGLLDYLNAVELSTRLRVVSLDTGEAPPRICSLLQVPPDSELVRAVRIRDLHDMPYSLSNSYLLRRIGGRLTATDLANTSMINLVQRAGASVEKVNQVLTATLAEEASAQHLEVPVGAPLMRVNRLFFDADLVPFYAAEILYRADLYEYHVTLRREPGQDFKVSDTGRA
ncbi:MAG: GntR family transcriptional regulator [Paracoccus sp. (in: a-proteobacteria)]|nr:GntR family transcriptional regulator [Paracoccus sp. (in: a-proteobacteria)]